MLDYNLQDYAVNEGEVIYKSKCEDGISNIICPPCPPCPPLELPLTCILTQVVKSGVPYQIPESFTCGGLIMKGGGLMVVIFNVAASYLNYDVPGLNYSVITTHYDSGILFDPSIWDEIAMQYFSPVLSFGSAGYNLLISSLSNCKLNILFVK